MSKKDLKKELENMTSEQLRQLILEAYSAKKEIKSYFDFFVNPDSEKLFEKYRIMIAKELDRSKRGGYAKGRISMIKRLISEFESYQPGYRYEIDLMLFTVSYSLLAEMGLHFPDTLMRGTAWIMRRALDKADLNLEADSAVASVKAMLGDDSAGSRYFKRFLKEELEDYLSGVSPVSR